MLHKRLYWVVQLFLVVQLKKYLLLNNTLVTPTIQGYLSNTSNWSLYGSYTGTTITGTFQGQSHYDDKLLVLPL